MQDVLILRIVFGFLAAIIAVFSVMAVTSRRILRAATYLLFVLFATSGLYFFLNYSFLGAVQLLVYAGGIIILYVFSILLTNTDQESRAPIFSLRRWLAMLATFGGIALMIYLLLTNTWPEATMDTSAEVNMRVIGHTLMGSEKGQYVLPFEVMSVLLLACMVGGLLIARKRS
ncbi:MAG: NADH-quinone oxidoreductase subunit J [Bacteroidales bacterium]|nr:NADH-quinone oxidoreductase subunit J [Bacteroidales bacterium]MDE7073339.1 NADH-quinone oxidoreductase subunit J [Bacteroidales bacterium]